MNAVQTGPQIQNIKKLPAYLDMLFWKAITHADLENGCTEFDKEP